MALEHPGAEARLAAQIARAGGACVRAALDAPREVTHKGAVDLVTAVDLASEAAIRAACAAATPEIPVLAEEGGGAVGARTRWVVDPLDGTTNFVHGYPAFCVSVALEVDGVLHAGCVYDPLRDEAYLAQRGGGARCGGQALAVSSTPDVDRALLLTGFAYDRRERAAWYLAFVQAFLERSQGIRRAGSAALDLCAIAAGRADGYWEFNLQPWDVAAGALLVAEAGGVVTAPDGGPLALSRPHILATNGRVHAEMREILVGLLSSRGGP